MARRILVVGAGGFLGRHIAARLRSSSRFAVTAVGRHAIPAGFALDCSDADAVDALLAELRPEAIVNAAGRREGNERDLRRDNLIVVETILAAARRAPGMRFIQLGSAAEYGPAEHPLVSEDDPCRPQSAYGRAKLAASETLLSRDAGSAVSAIVFRLFNVVGVGMSADSAPGRWLAQLAASHGRGRVRMGRLDAVRDFIAADDVANAVTAALDRPEIKSTVINICSGRGRTIEALLRRMGELAGIAVDLEIDRAIARTGDPDHLVGDPSRAARLLGFTASADLDPALVAATRAALRVDMSLP